MIARSSLHEKINYLSLILISVTLPFHILACSYATAIFVINQLAEGNIKEKIKRITSNKIAILFILFFMLHLVGLLFTQNIKHGSFDIEKKISLLIFPLFICSTKIKSEHVIHILISFLLACFILSLLCIANSTHMFIQTGDPSSFILGNLTSITKIHRVYFSMYLLFCIYILFFIQKKNLIKSNYSTILSKVLIIYFTALIFLMASRIVVIVTILSFIILSVTYISQTKKILQGLSFLLLFFSLTSVFLVIIKPIRTVMINTYEDLDKGNSEYNYTGPNLRVEIWKSSMGIIKENIWGVGTGDTEDELYKSYVTNNFRWGIKDRFNAHNQYLQTMLSIGIIGLAALLLCLFWPATLAFSNKEYLYLGFILLFASTCLTESMLCAQKGIVFYAFFNSLLAFHYPKMK